MSNPVATVTYVKGQVWAKAPDGSLRALAIGNQVNADEVIVTAEGAGVELDFGDGIPVAIAGNQEVSMGRDLWDELAADADEAALEDESVQQALAILEQGGDLLEELEDTAAGLNGGAGGGGISFVQLSRLVIDAPELNRFEFGDNPDAPAALPLQTTQAANYPPTSTDVSLQGDEDTTITGRIPASDPDGDVLTYQIVNQPLHGSVVLDPRSGEFVYTPAANYHGTDSFEVSITDGRGNSTSSTVSITVTAVNDLPVTANVNLNTDEDTAVAGQIVASDLDGDTLAYSLATAPVNGSVTVDPATGAFVYTPDVNFNGTDSFIVTVSDGQGGSVSSTVTIGIVALNDAPATTDLNLSTEEDVAVNGQITATDIDGDALSYAVTTAPQNGVLVLNTATGEYTYTPNTNYNGSDSFEVTISDGNGGTTTSTVTVGVTPANDAPTVTPVALGNINEDGNLIITQNDLLVGAGDIDGDSLRAINLTLTTGGGSVVDNGDGTWTFTPTADWNGAVDFSFDVFDGTMVVPNTATLTVLPVNDAPTTSNIALTTDEDTAIAGQVTATDIDGDVLSYTVTTAPQNGVLVLNAATGEFTYTPNTNYNGSDSFEVTISDGNGGTTTSTVTVGVTPVNDVPTVTAIALGNINEDGNLIITQNDLLVGAGDIDGDSLRAINLTLTTGGGSVVDNGDGTWTFTPTADWNGAVDFSFDVFDGTMVVPNTATLTVLPVNDAPTTSNIALTTEEDTAVSGQVTATDIDGDALSYAVTTAPQNGVLVLNTATGEYTYTPNANYNGSESFEVTISDGNGGTTTSTITVGVTPVNDAPTVTAITLNNIDEDGNLLITQNDLLTGAGDVDGDALTAINLTLASGNGTLIENGDGTWTFTPTADWNGAVDFSFDVFDGTTTVRNTASLTVLPVNDAPTTSNIALTTDEDTAVSGQVTATDIDGDALNYTVTVTPQNGVLVLNAATGEFTYTPNTNYNGSDSFEVTISDGNGGTTTSTVTVGVTPANDAPIAVADAITIDEDTSVVIDVRANDSDIDGDSLTVVAVTQGTNGNVVIDVISGNPIYTPNFNFNGSDSFTYTISDGQGGTSTTTVNITVNAVDDPSVLTPDWENIDEDTTVNGNVLGNDNDVDSSLTVTNFSINGTNYNAGDTATINGVGTLSMLANGDYAFTPVLNYNGSVPAVTYTTNTGFTSTLNIAVDPVNDEPVAVDDNLFFTSGLKGEYWSYQEGVDGDNLTIIFQSLEFIANNPADTTFISTQVNYGSIVNGLGGNNGLQQFLGDDSATLSSDPDNSSDGIMRLTGLIDMEEGTYRFRVAADDGFSVRINGTVVAEYHLNHWAEPRENFAVTGLPFEYTVTSAGLQNIEIIYWDTGENASLRVEMRDVNNDVYEILSGDKLYSTGALTIGEDQQLVISADSLLINDYDVEGDAVTIVSVQDAVNGTVSLVGENITFIPDAGYSGLATFTYSLMDSNGAVSEPAKVTVVVTASNDDPQLTDHHAVVSQTTMQGLKVDFYNYNEPLDGPNITNLSIIESFIASRTPNANFISTSLFYSEGNNDLGSGNNLQNWIGSDSESLIYLDRQSTTDAILQAQGKIYLEAGTYNFRVRADDGYSIKINGSTVAEINYVQSPTGSIHDPFTITQGGYYDLEALYWDQGGQFVFEVEISSDGGVTYAPLDTASLVHEPETLLYTVTAAELLANATDIDGDSLSFLRVDNAVGGSVTFDVNTGVIAFAIEPGFIGTPSFDYTVADGNGGQATATTFINIVQNQYQGSESSDILTGSSSNDQLVALDGDDTLTGGAGSDVLFGGLGADTFVWNLSDAGSPGAPAVDKVGDFNPAQGDVLHLADLLQGEESNPLTDYLHFDSDGSNTRVHISSNGGYASAGYDAGATDQIVVLEGISLSGTNTEIIAQLQNLNNLQVD